ncbi:hypothetical protein [Neoasaia chiangmaiensis]|uniref:hypothetical protein n=1 Tax=Neoasaia chiangmaiensis TaxID=320497 RepID=UPI00147930F4|nr:hypothetical protein [Neoasaia chiangmaiensis]
MRSKVRPLAGRLAAENRGAAGALALAGGTRFRILFIISVIVVSIIAVVVSALSPGRFPAFGLIVTAIIISVIVAGFITLFRALALGALRVGAVVIVVSARGIVIFLIVVPVLGALRATSGSCAGADQMGKAHTRAQQSIAGACHGMSF